jgi:hypothetical protein
MSESLRVVKAMARIHLERMQPDAAIVQAITPMIEGLFSLRRLGFSVKEILSLIEKELEARDVR